MEEAAQPVIGGDLKTLIRVSLPIMFFLLCEGVCGFIERIFLSYHALESVQGSLSANYLATIFQSPCIAIGAMAQVFVGIYHGKEQNERIGPCVWQLIWFSLFSSLVTLPLSHWASSFYFSKTAVEVSGSQYFRILSLGNFLYPLSTALASFYLGRGKTVYVTALMLAGYGFSLFLSWFFIFGIDGILPSLGAQGAALAKCMSLALVCSVLLRSFLTKKNRRDYRTDSCSFSLIDLWHYCRSGVVRALGYLSSKLCWAAICYMMIKKGGPYLDALTVGGTVTTFLVFITNGMYKAILTIASNLIGADKDREFWGLCRSFTIYTAIVAALLLVPLIFFPQSLIYFFDLHLKTVFEATFPTISHWIWLYLVALTIQMNFCALLVTLREIKYQLGCYLILWPVSVLFVYLGLGLGEWSADKLWLVMALESLIAMVLFLVRLYGKSLQSTEIPPFKID
jgi:MATE family multidrug resistance protein